MPEGQWCWRSWCGAARRTTGPKVPTTLGLSSEPACSQCRRWSTFSMKVCIIFIEKNFGVGIDMHISILYLYTWYKKVCQHATKCPQGPPISESRGLQLVWCTSLPRRLVTSQTPLCWLEMPKTITCCHTSNTTEVSCGHQPSAPHSQKIRQPSILPACLLTLSYCVSSSESVSPWGITPSPATLSALPDGQGGTTPVPRHQGITHPWLCMLGLRDWLSTDKY